MSKQRFFARLSQQLFFIWVMTITLFAAHTASGQQIIPSVCSVPVSLSGTTTLRDNENAGDIGFFVTGTVPQFARLIINPGGPNEETALAVNVGNGNAVTIRTGGLGQTLTYNHTAGETVQYIVEQKAVFGYNNTTDSLIVLPKGILTRNYFSPGPTTYNQQTTQFQPGIHRNAFEINIPPAPITITWFLDGSSVTFNSDMPRCAAITYQGKLSNAGAAANGNYDFQFTVFDAVSGGTAQSGVIAANNIAVTNGVFTAPLNFASTFNGNNFARFLQIAVRPAGSTDAFTVLTPRQPITDAPFAVNAQRAFSVSGGFVQLPLTNNAPSSADCNSSSQYGQTRVDAVNNRLYVCMATGWKAFAPQ